jgi:hypothetical protein
VVDDQRDVLVQCLGEVTVDRVGVAESQHPMETHRNDTAIESGSFLLSPRS